MYITISNITTKNFIQVFIILEKNYNLNYIYNCDEIFKKFSFLFLCKRNLAPRKKFFSNEI